MTIAHSKYIVLPLLLAVICSNLTACGFQLRSNAPVISSTEQAAKKLNPSPKTQSRLRTALAQVNPTIAIGIKNTLPLQKQFAFAKQLESSVYEFYLRPEANISVTTNDANFTLIVDEITSTAHNSAFNYNRAVTKQELSFDIAYRLLKDNKTIGRKQVNIKRFLNRSPDNPNSANTEQRLVTREMHTEAANRIIQQINYLLSSPAPLP